MHSTKFFYYEIIQQYIFRLVPTHIQHKLFRRRVVWCARIVYIGSNFCWLSNVDSFLIKTTRFTFCAYMRRKKEEKENGFKKKIQKELDRWCAINKREDGWEEDQQNCCVTYEWLSFVYSTTQCVSLASWATWQLFAWTSQYQEQQEMHPNFQYGLRSRFHISFHLTFLPLPMRWETPSFWMEKSSQKSCCSS